MSRIKKVPRPRHRVLVVIISMIATLVGVLWLFPQQVLTVDSGPVKADVIVVLGGGSTERATRAAELYAAHDAPLVLCSGTGDCESNQQILEENGVLRPAILGEDKSRNTSENARFSIPLLRQHNAKRVIVVTTWYHSRRALNCFEHYAPDIQFYSRPSYYGSERADWQPTGTDRYIRFEYVKNFGYLFRYGISPL